MADKGTYPDRPLRVHMEADGHWYWTFNVDGSQWFNGAFHTKDKAHADYKRFNKESGISAPEPQHHVAN